MPCLFLKNVPPDTAFTPDSCDLLFWRIADVLGCMIPDIEVHVEDTQYKMLLPNGDLQRASNVHVHVEWHEGRSKEIKKIVGSIIHTFLEANGLGEGSDIAFDDYPKGSFIFNGVPVE